MKVYLQTLKDIFQYKKLNKKRKIYFGLFILCGISEIIVAIINNDFSLGILGIVMWLFSLFLFADQANENIIQYYDELVEQAIQNNEDNLKVISKFIKEKDWQHLEEVSKTIDLVYGDEQENENKSK